MTKKTQASGEKPVKQAKQTKQTKPPVTDDRDAATTVDHLLAVAGLTITAEEREYFIRAYPLIRESLVHLRIPEARDAEPALLYHADTRR